ncbi:MAG: hypothetical protein FWG62_07735 [Proteobacteria bacterium]|nr:hypothetical protein [Pseudomonadota bacterium]
MLTATTSASTSPISTYDRHGRPEIPLRAELSHPGAAFSNQDDTTTDQRQDQVSLSMDGLEKSRETGRRGQEATSKEAIQKMAPVKQTASPAEPERTGHAIAANVAATASEQRMTVNLFA